MCMKKATRLEVEICVIALETPIQTQLYFTFTALINCRCFPCFEHMTHLCGLVISFMVEIHCRNDVHYFCFEVVRLKDSHIQGKGQQTLVSL
jgi:hypothetical protein